MNFTLFQTAVAKQFQRMQAYPLFRTDVSKDKLWGTYLASFPEGSNPIYRKRTEHDCSCCRQFIRAVGNVVAVIDGKLETIWDGAVGDDSYQTVANHMGYLVRNMPIVDIFLHYEPHAGTAKTFEDIVGGVHAWSHFHINIPAKYVLKKADIPTKLNEVRTITAVFERGLKELTVEALDTVLELIAQNSLYRGEEHKFAVESFRKQKLAYDALPEDLKPLTPWTLSGVTTRSVLGFRNTSIGKLVTDLSEGKELEYAVKAFEDMMAPANYKRPTALVTKAMIDAAKAKVEALGLTSALERRYATLSDITINNVLYADRSARKAMGAFDSIAPTKTTPQNFDKVEEMPIEQFLKAVLPKATTIELMMDNSHTGNLMSLVAPVDPTALGLFKWGNNFSWSYNGDVADSIKERVKSAGGNVTGELCCRLAWFNHDDLDFHLKGPDGHIYFGMKRAGTGQLDVDMNAGCGTTRTPVENIFFPKIDRMTPGNYELFVNCWSKRDYVDDGFEVEIDIQGTVHRHAYITPMRQQQNVVVATFQYDRTTGLKLTSKLPLTTASKQVWGISTMAFQKVTAVMLSPNHWDGQGVGNRHYFFMLENCRNEGKARGFYNEFLKSDLDAHRKVIEMVGAKMKTENSERQLSGLGFSSTQRAAVLCRVTGSFSRVIKIIF